MHNKYYYLVASLPYIKLGDEPPMTKNIFIEECKKWLSSKDMKALLESENLYREEKTGPELLLKWQEFDLLLKEELAKAREAKKKNEESKESILSKGIISEENALLAERAFEKIRWNFLDEEKPKYFFDINVLIIYFLQLGILERLAMFNKDKGEKLFYDLCEVEYEETVR